MVRFNACEKYIDFSFCKEICEKYSKLLNIYSGEYFVYSRNGMKNVDCRLSGGFKQS